MVTKICLHCFAEELTKTIADFESQITRFELDPKSAVAKSEAFILKLKGIISKACESTGINENSKANSPVLNPRENRDTRKRQLDDKKKSHEKLHRKNVPVASKKQLLQKFRPNNMNVKRAKEIEKADKHLKTLEIETGEGSYNLFECLICHQKMIDKRCSRNHVLRTHFKIGFSCPNCGHAYFNEKSFRLHVPKCCRAKGNKVNVKLPNGEKTVRVQLHSSSKRSKSPGLSQGNNKNAGQRILNPKNIKVLNPFDGFSLKKAMNVKIKISRLKMGETDKSLKNLSNCDEKETKRAEENYKAIKIKGTEDQDENNSKILDIGKIQAELIFGKEQIFSS